MSFYFSTVVQNDQHDFNKLCCLEIFADENPTKQSIKSKSPPSNSQIENCETNKDVSAMKSTL